MPVVSKVASWITWNHFFVPGPRRHFLMSIVSLALLACLFVQAAWSQTSTWRPIVLGMDGMVSSGHYGVSMTGYKMLADGGNAIDAAAAAGFASTVFEPSRTGLGGDLFMLIYVAKTGEVKFVNGTGWAPKSASIAELAARGGQREDGSIAPLVPGATSGLLLAAQKYGRLGRAKILAPSIERSESGFAVSENLQNVLKRNQPRLAPFPSTTRVWFRNGEPVKMGDVVVQPELGRTFRAIAAGGSDAFYRGPIARRVVEYLSANGGSMLDASDFAEFNAEESEPLHIRYKGYDIYGCPPNSHGHVMLQALNILEGVNLKAMGHNSALYLHYVTEALKLAFADRDAFVSDPRFIKDIPMRGMLSKEYANQRRNLIRADRAMEGLAPPGNPRATARGQVPRQPVYTARAGTERVLTGAAAFPEWIEGLTTYVAAVDKDRNMVSMTSTIWSDFGNSMYAEPGFFLNNRMGLFYTDPKDVNVVAPRKRPRMTLNPVLVLKDKKPFLAFGTPGGDTMPQAQLQFFLNFAEFGMNVQQAVEQPYVVSSSLRRSLIPHQVGGTLSVSERAPEQLRRDLAKLGHNVVTHDAKGVGSIKAILVNPATGVLMGGAAPATDSYAIGW